MRRVTFSYDLITTSQKINRDGAAQITLRNLSETTCIINNAIPLHAFQVGSLVEFKEDINQDEVSECEYWIKVPTNTTVLLTRKFYKDER